MKVSASSSSSSSSSLPSTNQGCKTTNIGEDIWFEIFVYLPLTLIFKFKCVSKIWLLLLSKPYFINKWIKHNNSNKSVPWALLYGIRSFKFNDRPDGQRKLKSSTFSTSIASLGVGVNSKLISSHDGLFFKFLPSQLCERNEKLHVEGSSNGLVLLAATSQNHTRYFVCNPLTQKWDSLPPPSQPFVSRATMTGFICECLPFTCYKVVRIPTYGHSKIKLSIDIFSSDKNEWTTCQVSCPEDFTWSCNGLVCHNGDLLWIKNQNRILAYNLNINECRLIDLPAEEMGYLLKRQWLYMSEGLICCARVRKKKRSSCSLSVWVLTENWQLLHKDLQLNDIFKKVNSELFSLAFDPVDMNVIIVCFENCIWECNIRTRKLEKLCEIPCRKRGEITESDTIAHPIVLKLLPTIVPAPALLENHMI